MEAEEAAERSWDWATVAAALGMAVVFGVLGWLASEAWERLGRALEPAFTWLGALMFVLLAAFVVWALWRRKARNDGQSVARLP